MKKRSFIVSLIIVGLYLTSTAFAGEKVHWGYSGHEGPEYWGKLNPKFSPCSKGRNQSPINLTGMIEGELLPITVNYQAGGNEILNNGHTIQVNYMPGSTINVNGDQFELKQFHFHSPSENIIEGKSYPMEAHFVHADKKGNLAVIAIMFKGGDKNAELEKAWIQMPEKSGQKNVLPKHIDANILLPQNRDYYRFNGSLTTPPCSEGVWWLVIKQIATASKEQIEQFSHTMRHPNNRPVQPVNARMILK
ncbi:MAG: carbonic anhydrase [Desulfobacula sp.]|jgi:carbonic anhydrase|nr:carbonic anhydrase [Desulfobacula sp.]MBT6341745.1 carbonic anhydrase [Desulfobacula sp.]MBT7262042.1 carbonic anhydrase [Desulfobacula sp.]